MSFVESGGERRWCLQSSSFTEGWCSDALPDLPDGTVHARPPSGMWRSASGTVPPLVVSCPSPPTIARPKENSRHGGQNARQNRNVKFVLDHPATCLLFLLNAGLAFLYWDRRVGPSSVCKRYESIVEEHEWWRGLSGATAHFEPLHIGFNMMSLNTLGRELEPGFGSIVFLVYNVALIVFTTAVMMGMVYARLRWTQRVSNRNPLLRANCEEKMQRLRETSTVGYSAVLFAWMVVSTMERTAPTCPIPFFSDVCFSTRSAPGLPFLKFNVSPVVSLFVAQFVMPRVSFMGHLAGIVCGFCLHWGWAMPPLEICSPNVLIGGAFFIGLVWRRRIIPVRPLLMAAMDEGGRIEHEDYLISLLAHGDGGDEGPDGPRAVPGRNGDAESMAESLARGRARREERELEELRRKRGTLLLVRNSMGAVAIASCFFFNMTGSLVVSQFILLAYFACAVRAASIVWAYSRSGAEPDVLDPEKARLGAILRGLFLSAVLTIVCDSMAAASWIALPVLAGSGGPGPTAGPASACAFAIVRTTVNLLALVISSKVMHDMKQVGGGIFCKVFSVVLETSRSVGDNAAFAPRRPLWTAFEGRGVTLGR